MEDFNNSKIITQSEIDVENFKCSQERKKQVCQKCRLPYYTPIIVYVKNHKLPDLTKTIYIVHMYSDIDSLIETVKNYLSDIIEEKKYGLKTESQENGFLLGDLSIQEVWEDYKNVGDKFLYLILDIDDNYIKN